MNEVTVTISGPVGCGKTAVYMEIMIALRAAGITIIHADPDAVQSEINMGAGDTHADLEMYQPQVRMIEEIRP